MNRKIAFALAAVLAAGHAMPETKKHLQEAATELKSVATDLEAGNVIAAKRLDASLAKAAHALATWHFYRAKESWGKTEEADAGKDLVMAANYLQNAANSANLTHRNAAPFATSCWMLPFAFLPLASMGVPTR